MPVYAFGEHRPELPAPGTYWIAPTAVVIGRVRIHPGASVWWGAVLRGDTDFIEIGPRSNIQDNAVVHCDPGCPTIVGADCTVGHAAILHGARLEDGCLVGMGACVLNRAVIGAGSLVGAKALVTEDVEIPPRSLVVGSPAKPKRTLEDAAVERIKRSADNYQERWRRYAGELVPLDPAAPV